MAANVFNENCLSVLDAGKIANEMINIFRPAVQSE